MVTVKPAPSAEKTEELFRTYRIPSCEGQMAMIAYDGDREVGCGLFSLVDSQLTLLFVDYPKNDLFLCDLISRGVMNYGANRGALDCDLVESAPKAEFVAFGFIPDLSASSVNIIRTFTMCTHCKKSKEEEK